MKAIVIENGFGLEHLKVKEKEMPLPGPSEVLVKLRAVSLNSRDLGVINGFYFPDLSEPLIPVSDGVGEVVAVGDQVTRFQLGDRVNGIFTQKWISGEATKQTAESTLGGPLPGLLAEYAVLPETGLVGVPDYLTDEEAATLPCAGVTAWHAIVEQGKVKAGDTVVVQGTGGVSLFALQFAKLHGAKVIITSSSNDKLVRAKSLGADHGINYKENPNWEKEVLKLTGERGADHIVELGGAATLNQSVECLRVGGKISLIGGLSGFEVGGFQIVPAIVRRAALQAINVGSRDMFEAMNRALEAGQLHPVVDRVFSFHEALDAFHSFAAGSYFGKIVISFQK
ncbi:NAD(P)-dependent alcohol dehydrogenase [Paenibacillus sp. GCM10027627]|uniref:zinc-dependent alcohol dehydrogenase family protein n=1 Tax=unclassified Paenibacillus TaxID=185978 RepID=UPI003636DA42